MKLETASSGVRRLRQPAHVLDPVLFTLYRIEVVLVGRPDRLFPRMQSSIRKDHYRVVADERRNQALILSAERVFVFFHEGFGGHCRFQCWFS